MNTHHQRKENEMGELKEKFPEAYKIKQEFKSLLPWYWEASKGEKPDLAPAFESIRALDDKYGNIVHEIFEGNCPYDLSHEEKLGAGALAAIRIVESTPDIWPKQHPVREPQETMEEFYNLRRRERFAWKEKVQEYFSWVRKFPFEYQVAFVGFPPEYVERRRSDGRIPEHQENLQDKRHGAVRPPGRLASPGLWRVEP